MSYTIYKYDIPVIGGDTIEVPQGAKFLSVGVQNDRPVMWALVDPARDKEPREVISIATGISIEPTSLNMDYLDYLGTFQLGDALPDHETFVGHVFIVKIVRVT